MREVAVIGIGATKFGELWDLSFREIGIQAGLAAVYDANLSGEDIDALYVGNMSAGRYIQQEHVAALIADYSGMARDHIPAGRHVADVQRVDVLAGQVGVVDRRQSRLYADLPER